ncbi:Crp/Fnr family transcriptional regulator [Pedobacter nototheniae]|uniref:Crp/Fnr family transcriptional regulator n=1 Tax=Pedobacter nototheniae TaxID=2488994 RepID=UPI00292FC2B2|nr:Crp/Fnr family transcriptional regulator [Pedobacter nototheniae]
MTALEKHLADYFGVITATDLTVVTSRFKLTKLKKGEFFLKAGKTVDRLAFIQSGLLRIFVNHGDKEITQWIAQEAYFLTDLSGFILEAPARWNIQALTDVTLYSISKTDYSTIGKQIPAWQTFETRFITKCFSTMEDRIFSHLSMSAEERYHHFFNNNKTLFNAVPLQYIASMLGMTPETFSRIRKK